MWKKPKKAPGMEQSKPEEPGKKARFEWDYLGENSKGPYSIADALKMPTYRSRNHPYLKLAADPSRNKSVNVIKKCETSSSLFSVTPEAPADNSSKQEYMKLFSCFAKHVSSSRTSDIKPRSTKSSSGSNRIIKKKDRKARSGDKLLGPSSQKDLESMKRKTSETERGSDSKIAKIIYPPRENSVFVTVTDGDTKADSTEENTSAALPEFFSLADSSSEKIACTSSVSESPTFGFHCETSKTSVKSISINVQPSQTTTKMSLTTLNNEEDVVKSESKKSLCTVEALPEEEHVIKCSSKVSTSIKFSEEEFDAPKTYTINMEDSTSKVESPTGKSFQPPVYGMRPVAPTPIKKRFPSLHRLKCFTDTPKRDPNLCAKTSYSSRTSSSVAPTKRDQSRTSFNTAVTKRDQTISSKTSFNTACERSSSIVKSSTCTVKSFDSKRSLRRTMQPADYKPAQIDLTARKSISEKPKSMQACRKSPRDTDSRLPVPTRPPTVALRQVKVYTKQERPKSAGCYMSLKDSYIMSAKRTCSAKPESNRKGIPILVPSEKSSKRSQPGSSTLKTCKSESSLESSPTLDDLPANLKVEVDSRPDVKDSTLSRNRQKSKGFLAWSVSRKKLPHKKTKRQKANKVKEIAVILSANKLVSSFNRVEPRTASVEPIKPRVEITTLPVEPTLVETKNVMETQVLMVPKTLVDTKVLVEPKTLVDTKILAEPKTLVEPTTLVEPKTLLLEPMTSQTPPIRPRTPPVRPKTPLADPEITLLKKDVEDISAQIKKQIEAEHPRTNMEKDIPLEMKRDVKDIPSQELTSEDSCSASTDTKLTCVHKHLIDTSKTEEETQEPNEAKEKKRRLPNLAITKLENATVSITFEKPLPPKPKPETPCICKKVVAEITEDTARKPSQNSLSIRENIVMDILKPHMEEAPKQNEARISMHEVNFPRFTIAESLRKYTPMPRITASLSRDLSKGSPEDSLRKVKSDAVGVKSTASLHGKKLNIIRSHPSVEKFLAKILPPSRTPSANMKVVQECVVLKSTRSQVENRKSRAAVSSTSNTLRRTMSQEGARYSQGMLEKLVNVEEVASKHSVCLRKSKMRTESKDVDPTDIIRQIKTIREKLAEASKSISNLKAMGQVRKRGEGAKYVFATYDVYRLGEKGSGLRSRGDVQDFYDLRDEHVANGTLFEDPDFPADDSSLFFSRRPDRHYEWLRPGEIVDDPQLFVEGYSRFDVQQGELGDCWLLAAVANLTLYRRLFFQIVPDDQGFDEKYAGIFHFRFWQYGRWIDVVIDDRLPTYRGQLIYLRSTEENEFWSALLEKAYAKLHGSYEALKGGSTCEAMEDFTGGVTEMYEMNATPPNLFKIVLKAYERGSLMGASLEPDPEVLEAETRDGLIRGHAYSITRVKYVDIQTPNTVGKIPLLRLRNPWGNENEWNGPWSDQSPEWRFIPEEEKENLGLTFDNDGEFWMSFKDFQTHFDRLEICNLTPDSLTEEEISEGHKKQWEMSVFEGEWVRGVTAGGCRNYLDTFWHNPQYRITLTDVDEDDEEGKCTVIVALMQKNRRSRRLMGVEFLTIGFAMYYLPDPNRAPKPLDLGYFKYNASVARSPSFINLREVSCRFKLPPGTYCIVPSTFEPNEEGEFLLRVFSENKNNMEEHDEEVGIGEMDEKVVKQPATVEENQETDKVKEFFLKLAGDDLEVDWKELKDILDYAMRSETNKGFSKDVCRSMVAMLDTDRSGKLGFEEFKILWLDIRNWKLAFKMYDKDNSGALSGFELRQALNSAGYHLNNNILNILMHRYGNKASELQFDDFILCAVKLKTMIETFKQKDPDSTNKATFTLEDWIETTLYA